MATTYTCVTCRQPKSPNALNGAYQCQPCYQQHGFPGSKPAAKPTVQAPAASTPKVHTLEGFTATGEMVDTAHGPENRVTIRRGTTVVATRQEPASTEQVLLWYVESFLPDGVSYTPAAYAAATAPKAAPQQQAKAPAQPTKANPPAPAAPTAAEKLAKAAATVSPVAASDRPVDTGKGRTATQATSAALTLAAATVGQLIESMASKCFSQDDVDMVANMVATALEARGAALKAEKAAKLADAQRHLEQKRAAEQAALEAARQAKAAADEAARKAAEDKAAKAKAAASAPRPTTYKALTGLGGDGVRLLAAGLGIKGDGVQFGRLCGDVWAKIRPASDTAPAKAAASTPPAQPTKAAHPAAGTIMVADGKGGYTPATAAQLMAALDALTAPKAA